MVVYGEGLCTTELGAASVFYKIRNKQWQFSLVG